MTDNVVVLFHPEHAAGTGDQHALAGLQQAEAWIEAKGVHAEGLQAQGLAAFQWEMLANTLAATDLHVEYPGAFSKHHSVEVAVVHRAGQAGIHLLTGVDG